jgi:hypothetical protein
MPKEIYDSNLKKKYIYLAKKWCEDNLGINYRRRKSLTINFSTRNRKKPYIIYGDYCWRQNRITIYEKNCKTLYDLIGTFIHEYTHYLQPHSLYKIYEKSHYYSTNPFERQAKRNEKKYTKICIKEIKNLID